MPSECAMCAVSVLVTDGHDWEEGDLCYTCLASEHACLKQRTAALQSQLKEAKEGWDSAIADLYAAAEIAKGMQSQLDALTWTEITPENLPKIGDELFAHHVFRDAQWDTVSSVTNIHATWRVDDFLNCGWTHFRPINPPPRALEPQ